MAARTGVEQRTPTRREMLVHRAKVRAHQAVRALREGLDPLRARPGTATEALCGAPLLAEVRSALWRDEDPREWILQAGKVENLRVARRAFDGVELAPGQVFSFWAHLGRPTKARGFVAGRELREGCVVPAVAGGICQLSNALYAAAVDAGLRILERHPHSRVLPGSAAEVDRDATVLWNYVDLRFVAGHALRIEVAMTGDELVVRLRGPRSSSPVALVEAPSRLTVLERSDAPSCLSCDKVDCERAVPAPARSGQRAFLVDAVWPEFDAYVRRSASPNDHLFLPLDGARWGRSRYAWCSDAFADEHVHSWPRQTLRRALISRRLSKQGAERQHALLRLDAELADAMARRLRPDMTQLVVTQSLLPHLWSAGHLAGRRFSVLANRLPLGSLQARLDAAARLHRESSTAADFRAAPSLVRAEREALDAAERIVTPHAAIAAEHGARTELLPWCSPPVAPAPQSEPARPRVLFPASTVARKGCYELREALAGLDVELVTAGPVLEGDDFWAGQVRGSEGPVDLVVLPAWVEHAPRRLLAAAASGLPVVASTACGLHGVGGVGEVAPGDVAALRTAIVQALAERARPLVQQNNRVSID
ncbi:MAG: VanW family protein [Myxococcota bacterium]